MSVYKVGEHTYYNLDRVTRSEIIGDKVYLWFDSLFFREGAVILDKTDALLEKLGIKQPKEKKMVSKK